jgi:hypothetical protein
MHNRSLQTHITHVLKLFNAFDNLSCMHSSNLCVKHEATYVVFGD